MTKQPTQNHDPPSGLARGFIVFAWVMMIMAGGFQTLAGVGARWRSSPSTSSSTGL